MEQKTRAPMAGKTVLEHTFALNHLAPFLLTNLFIDRLKGGAPPAHHGRFAHAGRWTH